MKTFLSTISFLFIFFYSNAQSLAATEKYIWKNKDSNITASVEVYGLQYTNKSGGIFYLNGVDTLYNISSDSLFNTFINRSAINCPVIKISFYNLLDTVPDEKIKLYGEELLKFILPDVYKKFPQIRSNNSIISGIDFFAAVALFAAINSPLKTNKTALFFNENDNFVRLNDIGISEVKKLNGKVYLYVNHENIEDKFSDSFANEIALNSSIVLYKFDYFGSGDSSKVFEEALNWLLADGNNFIIRNND